MQEPAKSLWPCPDQKPGSGKHRYRPRHHRTQQPACDVGIGIQAVDSSHHLVQDSKHNDFRQQQQGNDNAPPWERGSG